MFFIPSLWTSRRVAVLPRASGRGPEMEKGQEYEKREEGATGRAMHKFILAENWSVCVPYDHPLRHADCEWFSGNLERYSTVTDFARLRGWSTSHPRRTAMW